MKIYNQPEKQTNKVNDYIEIDTMKTKQNVQNFNYLVEFG